MEGLKVIVRGPWPCKYIKRQTSADQQTLITAFETPNSISWVLVSLAICALSS